MHIGTCTCMGMGMVHVGMGMVHVGTGMGMHMDMDMLNGHGRAWACSLSAAEPWREQQLEHAASCLPCALEAHLCTHPVIQLGALHRLSVDRAVEAEGIVCIWIEDAHTLHLPVEAWGGE